MSAVKVEKCCAFPIFVFGMRRPQNVFPSRIEDVPKPVPIFDRSNKPSEISIQERYDTKVLRRVVVPVKVMTLFQAMAQHNTHKNIETCGVLTGKLVNIFFHIIGLYINIFFVIDCE